MKDILCSLDRQILEALEIGKRFNSPKPNNINKILFCGMGGSAIGGDVLRLMVNRNSTFPFKVSRSPEVPASLDENTFVILSSYSGNTRETLQVAEQVFKRGIPSLVMSSGGSLANLALRKQVPWLRIPPGVMPRCAIGYTSFSLLPVLKRWGWANYKEADIQEVLKIVRTIPSVKARQLAKQLKGKSVHFYGTAGLLSPALTRWRGQFAENAKMLASHHLIPEVFHNEIEGWSHPSDIIRKSAAVFFTDRDDATWLAPKIKAAAKLIQKNGAKVFEVPSQGKSVLARLFSLIVLGDWVSYELALLNGVDPLAIPAIEAVKKV